MEPTVGGVTFGRSTTPLPVDAVARPSGRPRIVLIGVGTWCRHLQVELESVSDLDVAVRAPRSVTTLARERADLVVRVGMRPDARTVRGRAFDLAWNRSVPVERSVTYWIGTDVYDTVHDVERHGVVVDRRAGTHLAGAPWMTDELRRIGIPAETAVFPTTHPERRPVAPLPDEFVVHAYVPQLKPDFYGRRVVEELARRRPDMRFEVWGSERDAPTANLTYRGRTDDMLATLDRTVVHLRLTRHDAFPATVREALGRGRWVLFPYEFPGVVSVPPWDIDRIETELDRLAAAFARRELGLNEVGRAAVEQFLDDSAARQLAARLTVLAGASR